MPIFCLLTIPFYQDATADNSTVLYVIVYNGLASSRSTIVHLPVSANATFSITRLDFAHEDTQLVSSTPTVRPARITHMGADYVVAFDSRILPPAGAAVLKISMVNSTQNGDGNLFANPPIGDTQSRVLHADEGDDVEVTNGLITAWFDR